MDVAELVGRWLPEARVISVEPLSGGFVNEMERVETDVGTFALRTCVSQTTAEMVAWEHALLERVTPSVPEVVGPLATSDGATFVEDEGRVISLWPFVEGRAMDPGDAGDLLVAGRILGRLHTALSEVRDTGARPGYPALAAADWHENRWWSWSGVDLESLRAAGMPLDIGERVDLRIFDRAVEEVPEALRALNNDALPRVLIHGDFYEGNLLIGDDGEVAAVLDWDECRLDWRAWDVANALWSFCRNETNSGLDREAATAFLAAYEPLGGALFAGEREAMGLLVRASRLWEALWGLGEIQRGHAGWDYFELNVAAVEGLSGFELS